MDFGIFMVCCNAAQAGTRPLALVGLACPWGYTASACAKTPLLPKYSAALPWAQAAAQVQRCKQPISWLEAKDHAHHHHAQSICNADNHYAAAAAKLPTHCTVRYADQVKTLTDTLPKFDWCSGLGQSRGCTNAARCMRHNTRAERNHDRK